MKKRKMLDQSPLGLDDNFGNFRKLIIVSLLPWKWEPLCIFPPYFFLMKLFSYENCEHFKPMKIMIIASNLELRIIVSKEPPNDPLLSRWATKWCLVSFTKNIMMRGQLLTFDRWKINNNFREFLWLINTQYYICMLFFIQRGKH